MPSTADQGAALLAIYDQAVVDVHGYLFARCRDRSTAEDLTADVFLGAVDGIRRSVPSEVTTAWLIGIARHKTADVRVARSRDADRARAAASVPEDDFVQEAADGEIADPDPWGRYRLSGTSTPPFRVDDPHSG